MTSSGFLGLPAQVQEIVLRGLDAEAESTQERIREAERARPVDPDLLASLRGDATRVEALRNALTSGQA